LSRAYLLHIQKILIKLHTNVHHYEKQCCVHEHVSRSKVKVTFKGHWKMLVRSETSTCIKGFQYNLAHMFTILRQSVECKIKVPAAKVKVTHRGQSSDKKITRDNNISRYFTEIAQSISPICKSIMPTSLSKASVTGVYPLLLVRNSLIKSFLLWLKILIRTLFSLCLIKSHPWHYWCLMLMRKLYENNVCYYNINNSN
jgi:hypothetical protein